MFPARLKRIALAGVTVLGTLSLLVAVSYLLRTRAVVGPRVAAALTDRAERHDISLRVGSLEPEGLTGLTLRDVDVSSNLREVETRLHAEGVTIYPSVWALLRGELRPDAIRLREARLQLSPAAAEPTSDAPPNAPNSSASSDSSADEAEPNNSYAPSSDSPVSVDIEARNLDVRIARNPEGPFGAPLRLDYLEATLETQGERHLADLRGYGRGPEGASFSVRPDPDSADHFLLEARAPLAVAPLLPVDSLEGATLRSATFCPSCRSKRLCVRHPRLTSDDLTFESPEGCLEYRSGESSLRAVSQSVTLRRAGNPLPFRIRDVELDGHPARQLSLDAELESTLAGELDLEAHWDADSGDLEARCRFDRFHLRDLWGAIGLGDRLRDGVVTGEIRSTFDPEFALARVDGWLELERGAVQHPLLGREPLEIGSSRLQLSALADLDASAFSTPETRAAIGDSRPLQLSGYTIRSGPGWAFRLDARADEIRAPRLRSALPERLTRPATGATLEGAFDASVTTSGHTARPDSLVFDVAVDGDVRVLRGSHFADVARLAHEGPPAIRHDSIDLSLDSWTPIESLPDHVPRVLTAAEDARFWQHTGFDWRGVRNAMAHNLEVASLERGGSTITQQLAKNLFLSPDRTLARKIREIWVTWRLESVLDKERILELYFNVAKWAPGVRGIRAAARHYFDVAPSDLSIPQIVLLATLLPGPNYYGPLVEKGYLPSSRVEKVEHILSNLRFLDVIDSIDYGHWYSMARRGHIGGLDLTVCRDDEHAPPEAPDCEDVGERAADDRRADDLVAPG